MSEETLLPPPSPSKVGGNPYQVTISIVEADFLPKLLECHPTPLLYSVLLFSSFLMLHTWWVMISYWIVGCFVCVRKMCIRGPSCFSAEKRLSVSIRDPKIFSLYGVISLYLFHTDIGYNFFISWSASVVSGYTVGVYVALNVCCWNFTPPPPISMETSCLVNCYLGWIWYVFLYLYWVGLLRVSWLG